MRCGRANWSWIRGKYLMREIDQRSATGNETLLSLSKERGVVPRSDLGFDSEGRADSLVGYKRVDPGVVVMNKMQAWNGMFGLSGLSGIVSPEYTTLVPLSTADPRFLVYLLRSDFYVGEFSWRSRGMGTAFLRLHTENLLDTPFFVPAIETQRSIADYLDTETARIDALIEKKKRLVELLEARRRIVVSEGVSGNSPRIGPRLRYVSHLVRGSGFPHEKQGCEEGDLPFFKVGDLSRPANNPFLLECENWISHETALELRATIVPPDSVMFPKIGAALAGGVRRIATIPSVCDNNVLAVVPSTIEARYLRYWLSTVDLVEIANPGPVPSLDDDALKDLRVPITDRGRQSAIADHLDLVTKKLNGMSTQIQTQLHLLRERRQALITAAVTGELEVPGMAA